jgi:hypothetical protein
MPKSKKLFFQLFPFPRWLCAAVTPSRKPFINGNLALNFSPMAESAEALLDLYEYKMFPRILLMARPPNQNY